MITIGFLMKTFKYTDFSKEILVWVTLGYTSLIFKLAGGCGKSVKNHNSTH